MRAGVAAVADLPRDLCFHDNWIDICSILECLQAILGRRVFVAGHDHRQGFKEMLLEQLYCLVWRKGHGDKWVEEFDFS